MTDILNIIVDRIQHDSGGPRKIDWKMFESELKDVFDEHKKSTLDERGTLEAIVELVGYHTGRGYPELPERTS